MHINKFCFPIMILFCLAALPVRGAEGPILLKYEFSKDKPLLYRISTVMEQSQKVGEQSNEMKMVNTAETLFTLEEVKDNENFVLSSSTKRLQVMMSNPFGEPYEYDSNSDTNPNEGFPAQSLTPVFDALKGATVQLTLKPDGEIVAVEGYSELMKKITEKVPNAPQMGSAFSDEGARKQYEEVFPTFNDVAVSPGDTWETTFDMDMGPTGKAKGKKVFTFKGEDELDGRKTVAIAVNTEVQIDIDINQGLSTVTGSMKSNDSEGIIHFDPATGEIVKVDNKYKIVGKLNITFQGQQQVIEQNQNHQVTVELVPDGGSK